MKTDRISFIIGFLVTIGFATPVYFFINFRDENEFQRKPNTFYETLEAIDQRYNDLKYRFRPMRKTPAPVGLIAIDDDSVREVGRWPWSRDLIAEMTEKLVLNGAKTVTFDVIFSEPEKGRPENDQKLAQVVEKYKDNIILGTFSETPSDYESFQDYCVTEAFLNSGGADIVKLNPTFVVEDLTTAAFEELKWNHLFDALFPSVRKQREQEVLSVLKKPNEDSLSLLQKSYLKSEKSKATFQYCKRWLTPSDPLLVSTLLNKVEPIYKGLLAEDPKLSKLSLDEFATNFRASAIPHPVPQYAEWTSNIEVIQKPANYTASFIAHLDSDGYVRRYPLFYRSGNRIGSSFIPSLALQAYLLAKGYRADVKIEKSSNGKVKSLTQFTITDPTQEPEKKIVDLPVDLAGQLLLNYYGPQKTIPYIPAKEIFSDDEEMNIVYAGVDPKTRRPGEIVERVNKKQFLKDRNLIVGATAVALYDLRNTPTEANYPGPEIHLTALANLLDQDFLQNIKSEYIWAPVSMLILGLTMTFAFSALGSVLSLVIAIASLCILIYGDFWLFTALKYRSSGLFIGLMVLSIYVTITIFRFFTEEKTKKEIRSTFSKYVSPAIVDELLENREKLALGGRRQRMTVFFSDLRGFTTISEKLPPEELSRILNLYLSPMTEIVFSNKGTLDKYMGDAIMAFFGAPIASQEHAAQACRCALQSLEQLKVLQAIFAKEGLPHLDIGIGINTGDMSVGNMGSNIVQNYTVMGDAVNLASRLEGTNKEYGSKIIISEFTYQDIKDQFTSREIDQVRVKGKTEPVKIYELVKEGPPATDVSDRLKAFSSGYQCYQKKEFNSALEFFKKFPEDPVAQIYVKRCIYFQEEPPPPDWDGVYSMKTK